MLQNRWLSASSSAISNRAQTPVVLSNITISSTGAPAVAPNIAQKDQFLASWHAFLSSRKALRQRIEQAETSVDKQKRLQREKQPPAKSAKVFHWAKDSSGNGYVREQVSKKWRQDILGQYSSNQSQYDSYFNEWDCCSELGSDDELEEEEESSEDTLFEDYDEMNVESPVTQTTPIGLDVHLDPDGDNEEGPPCYSQPEDAAYSPSIDGLEEEVLEEAHIYYGFILPISPHCLIHYNRQTAAEAHHEISWLLMDRILLCTFQPTTLSQSCYLHR